MSDFLALSTCPVYTSGFIECNSESTSISLLHSQRDDLERKTYLSKHLIINDSKYSDFEFPQDLQNIVQFSTHKQTKINFTKTNSNLVIEIFNNSSKVSKMDVSNIHGIYFSDPVFGGVCWSDDGMFVCYVAETLSPNKTLSDFGEGFTGKKDSVLCLFSLGDQKVTVLETKGFAVGQPSFLNNDTIIFWGISTINSRFGLKFCTNRVSGIYSLKISTGIVEHLSSKFSNARNPRLSLDKSQIIFLSVEDNSPHYSTSKLVTIQLFTKSFKIVQDIPRVDSNADFPGLYCDLAINSVCLDINGDEKVVLSSRWGVFQKLFSFNLITGERNLITSDEEYSWTLLCAHPSGLLLVKKSNVKEPNSVHLGNINTHTSKWIEITKPEITNLQSLLDCFKFSHLPMPNVGRYVDSILLTPTKTINDTPPPLIICPHGGPHSNFQLDFQELLIYIALTCKGYACLLVNYTGSIGYGENAVRSLLSNIGDLDVRDTHEAGLSCLGVDLERVGLFGGSHGGFISAFLVGMFPNYYKGVAVRNPVTNVASMVESTDIPDWCFIESGIGYNFEIPSILTPEKYKKMFECSPVSVIDKVTSPVLVLLGKCDRRVPPSQGRIWGEYLKAKGVDSSVVCYDGTGHSLDDVVVERKVFVEVLDFFNRTVKQSST